jgi:hypothetical protein
MSDTDSGTPSKQNRMPGNVLKALAELLESNGGIRTFRGQQNYKLSKTLDRIVAADVIKAVIFGQPGEQPIRCKLQLKVLQWQKKLDEDRYHSEVLDPFGVQSFEHRQTEPIVTRSTRRVQRAPIPAPSCSSSDSSNSSSSSSSEDSNPRIETRNEPPPQILFRPEKKAQETVPEERAQETVPDADIQHVTAIFEDLNITINMEGFTTGSKIRK